MPSHGKQYSRRKLLQLAGAGTGAALAGCMGGSGGGSSGPTQITYIDRDNSPATSYPKPYNKSHDKYEVKGKKVGKRYKDVLTQIRAGKMPAEVIGIDVVQLALFEKLGALKDIGSFVEGLEYRDDILGGLDPLFMQVEGKMVAMPFWIDASLYYYNKNHFEEAGLDPENPPRTWAEFKSAAEALDGINEDYPPIGMSFTGGLSEFFWWPFVWANGGQVVNDDGTKATIGQSAAVEALQFWVDLSDAGLTTDLVGTKWPDFHNLFAGENTSIMFSSSYGIDFVKENNKEMFENGNFGTAVFPKPEGGAHSSFLGGNSISIFGETSGSKFEAAKDFVKWVNSEEGMKVTQEIGYLPPRKKGFEIGQFAEEPYHTYVQEPKKALSQGQTLIHPDYEAIAQRIRPALENAFAGKKSPKQALADAERKINEEVLK